MSKPILGLVLGGILGILDGLTVLFYPEKAAAVGEIVLWSTLKGVIVGVIVGAIARKVTSLPVGILVGLGVALLFAYLVAAMPDPETGKHYYIEIMLPGGIVGAIVGYATQKYGTPVIR